MTNTGPEEVKELLERIADLQVQLSERERTIEEFRVALGAGENGKSAQVLAAAYTRLTEDRDRQDAQFVARIARLQSDLEEVKRKLTLVQTRSRRLAEKRDVELDKLRHTNQRILASKRWQAGEFVSRAIRQPGRNTLALPLQLIRLLRKTG